MDNSGIIIAGTIIVGLLILGIFGIVIALLLKKGSETAKDIIKADTAGRARKIIAANGSAVVFNQKGNLDDDNDQPPAAADNNGGGPNRLTDEALRFILQGRTIVGREEDAADGPA